MLQALQAENGKAEHELANAIRVSHKDWRLRSIGLQTLWVGGLGGMEADLVKRAKVPFTAIPAAGVHGVGVRALPGNLRQTGKGLLEARRLLRRFRPDVMLFTGGYVAVPVALASWFPGRRDWSRPYSLLYVPDIEPGLALRTLARFADQIAVTAGESKEFFSKRTPINITGYPTRHNLHSWTSEAAYQALDLKPDLPTLLVFGGSKGARSINRALLPVLPELLAEMQVIHVSGSLDWVEAELAKTILSLDQTSRYRAYPYLHDEMGAALKAADLVISRAGAASLGEYPLFGIPAVLVPYPHAWRYQHINARYLEKRGAAVVVADEDIPARLLTVVRELMHDEPRREAMGQAMRSLARPEAAESIASILHDLVASSNLNRM